MRFVDVEGFAHRVRSTGTTPRSACMRRAPRRRPRSERITHRNPCSAMACPGHTEPPYHPDLSGRKERRARPVVLVADDTRITGPSLLPFSTISASRTINATGGLEAVEIARRECPHLILMDLMMPDLNGAGALRIIRADPDCQDIPALAFTAQTLCSAARANADGFCAVVHEPITPRPLADAVKRCLADAEAGLRWTDLPKYDARVELAF
jgi:CheY-like chemotaxis protein